MIDGALNGAPAGTASRGRSQRPAVLAMVAALACVALAVIQHEQGKAAQGRRSVLCGTLFSCIDHLVAEGQAKPKPAPATPAAKAHQALSAKAASSKLHGEGEASTVKDAEKTIEGAAAVATA